MPPKAIGRVDLARPVLVRAAMGHAAGVDRKAPGADLGRIADRAVNDEAGHAALFGEAGHDVADDGLRDVAAGIDNDDVARRSDVYRLVHHQVVAGRDLDRKCRAAQLAAAVHRAQRRAAGNEPVHVVRQMRGYHRRERLDEFLRWACRHGQDAKSDVGHGRAPIEDRSISRVAKTMATALLPACAYSGENGVERRMRFSMCSM